MTPPRIATGIAVIDERGAILCVERGPDSATGAGEIAIPGGKLDPGETLETCARRELFEEVGIVATSISRLTVVTEDLAWGPDKHFVTLYFVVDAWTGEPRIMEPTKHIGLKWLFPSQIRKLIVEPDPEQPVFEPLIAFDRAGGITEVHWHRRARLERETRADEPPEE